MGYSSNLKKQRKPIVDYIEQELNKINNEQLSDNELFDTCDTILKVVEIKFNRERKDVKLYNKYNKMILEDILPRKIFSLSYMKPEDYELDIDEVEKEKSKDLKFIYLYGLKYYINIVELYSILNQNIMDSWITEEGKSNKKKLLSRNNEKLKEIFKKDKNMEERLHKHIENVNNVAKEYENKIKNKEFYNKLIKLVNKLSLSNHINDVIKEENQKNFYTYHLQSLNNDLKEIENLYDYCNERLLLMKEYLA